MIISDQVVGIAAQSAGVLFVAGVAWGKIRQLIAELRKEVEALRNVRETLASNAARLDGHDRTDERHDREISELRLLIQRAQP